MERVKHFIMETWCYHHCNYHAHLQGHQKWPRAAHIRRCHSRITFPLYLRALFLPLNLHFPHSIFLPKSEEQHLLCGVIHSLIINSVKVYWGHVVCNDKVCRGETQVLSWWLGRVPWTPISRMRGNELSSGHMYKVVQGIRGFPTVLLNGGGGVGDCGDQQEQKVRTSTSLQKWKSPQAPEGIKRSLSWGSDSQRKPVGTFFYSQKALTTLLRTSMVLLW